MSDCMHEKLNINWRFGVIVGKFHQDEVEKLNFLTFAAECLTCGTEFEVHSTNPITKDATEGWIVLLQIKPKGVIH